MSNQLPSALEIEKWTPAGLHQLIGCNNLVNSLVKVVKNGGQMQSMMVSGEIGSGKSASLKTLLKTLNCPSKVGDPPRPCGTCPDCQSYDPRMDTDGLFATLKTRVAEHDCPPLSTYLVNCGSVTSSRLEEIIHDRRQFCGQFIVVLDECHRLMRNHLDEMLLVPMEDEKITWIAATAYPEQLKPEFKRRFSLRVCTSLPSVQELSNFSAERCCEFKLSVDDPATLALLAKLSHRRPSECIRVLSLAALEADRQLKRNMVVNYDFLPKQ